jgi:pilus assembly protein TadC
MDLDSIPPALGGEMTAAQHHSAEFHQPFGLVSVLSSLRRGQVLLIAAAMVIGLWWGWHLALLLLASFPTWTRYRTQRLAKLQRDRIDHALPDAIDMLMLLIHSGCSAHRAFEQLRTLSSPVLWPALDQLLLRLHRGTPLAEALSTLNDLLGPQMIAVVDALRANSHYGTPLGPSLDRISDQMFRERQRRAEIAARTLAVRITFPLVVCILPAFALGALGPVVISAIRTVGSLDIR